jgi:hypothetical protein
MKSKKDIKALIHKFLALGGFHAFMFTVGLDHPLVTFTIVIMTAILIARIFFKKHYMDHLFPLALGLLFLPMKLFYWDRVDYQQRMSNLLLLALILTLFIIIKRHSLIKKFLYFFNSLSLKKRLITIFICSQILFTWAAFMLVNQGVVLGGDEPHYLVISHSIAKDGDINVFNQYARDEYRDFIDVRLNHHARVGKGFKVWYSYGHLPGLSLTLAPFFLVDLPNPVLYFLVRAYLGIFGSLMALLIYLFALKLWKNLSLSLFVTATYTFTAPIFFYTIHIFAELQASLLILSALYLLLYGNTQKIYSRTLLAGFLMGITVFWGLKFTLLIFLLSGGFFFYFVIKKEPKRAIMLAIFPFLFQVFFFAYLYYGYGNIDPMSIYNGIMTPEQEATYRSGLEHIPMLKRIETSLGIFFDQRDGLIPYNLFYLFAIPGLILALRKYRYYWPHLLISSAVFAFISFMGYSTVRAGYCPQARYLVPATWMFMLYSIIYYRETSNRLFRKIMLYLPLYGFGVVLYQVFHPFTLYQSVTHINLNRPGLMFQQWSNIYINVSDLLPSFVKVPGNFKYLPNIAMMLLVLLFVFLALKKLQRKSLSFAWVPIVTLLVALFALFPRVPMYNPILLAKEDAQVCKIYGESTYPTRTKERKFELRGKKSYSFTASTLKPADSFVLEFENRGMEEYEVVLLNFDEQLKTEVISAAGVKEIIINKPQYKRFGNAYYYRFHLKVKHPPPTKPSLYLQIYPQ